MAHSSRRDFVRGAAFATGALLGIRVLRAADAVDDSPFRAGVSPADAAQALAARMNPARERITRAAAVINGRFPAVREKILGDAAAAMRGMLLLPGSAEPTFVGAPPKWTTPRFGDDEYLWSLNRMNHWVPLLRAYALTGEDRYAEKVVAELDDWLVTAAPPTERIRPGQIDFSFFADNAPPPWRSLELGLRMFGSWTTLCEHLAGTRFLPAERVGRVARSARLHAEILAVVSPQKWPAADHNHFYHEMLGVLAAVSLFPELAGAPAWTDLAMRELARCATVQFTPDGGHIEGCPNYHNICAEMLARSVTLARAAGRAASPETLRRCAAAAEHTLHATRPTGTLVPWGDSSTGENWVDALLWSAKATGDLRCLQQMGTVIGADALANKCAAQIWESDDPDAFLSRLANPPTAPLARVSYDRGNDQVMLRSAWTRDAVSVFFACHSPLPAGSGHQHIDLGGFDLCAFGRSLVADPGPFTYREGADRKQFKSAAYHSVLTVDGREPFEYLNRWRYGPQKEGRVTSVREEDGVIRLESFHRNYEPVICRRTLALIDGRFVVVLDAVENLAPASKLQIYFHVDSTKVAWDPGAHIAVATGPDAGLVVAASAGLAGELLPGRVSEHFDVARPSTRVRLSDDGGGARRRFATVLVPFRGHETPPMVEALGLSLDGREWTFRVDEKSYRLAAIT